MAIHYGCGATSPTTVHSWASVRRAWMTQVDSRVRRGIGPVWACLAVPRRAVRLRLVMVRARRAIRNGPVWTTCGTFVALGSVTRKTRGFGGGAADHAYGSALDWPGGAPVAAGVAADGAGLRRASRYLAAYGVEVGEGRYGAGAAPRQPVHLGHSARPGRRRCATTVPSALPACCRPGHDDCGRTGSTSIKCPAPGRHH